MEKIIKKDKFDIKKINSIIEDFCQENAIQKDNIFKLQLITEEFLFNILFPNFEKDVQFSILKNDNSIIISFEYDDINFMNKINEKTIYSLKILRKETQEIICDEKDKKTLIKFVI